MSAAPDWYAKALATTPERAVIDADGIPIALRMWGPRDGVPVVLVHGGAAHAAWWDHIAPLLSECRVVALDLSGHGDSGWRKTYRVDRWRDEVLTVVTSEHMRGRPLLVGHSMGGLVTYAVMRDHAEHLAGALIVDSDFPRRAAGDAWRVPRDPRRRVRPDRDTMLARFRLMPHSEPRSPFVLRHVAEESVVAVDGGWSWKFDPRIFGHDGVVFEDVVALTERPVAIVRGDRGLLDGVEAEALAQQLGALPVITVEDCGHHVLLDRPIRLAGIIREHLPAEPVRAAPGESENTIIGGS